MSVLEKHMKSNKPEKSVAQKVSEGFEKKSDRIVKQLDALKDAVKMPAYSPDGKVILAIGNDGEFLYRWEPSNYKPKDGETFICNIGKGSLRTLSDICGSGSHSCLTWQSCGAAADQALLTSVTENISPERGVNTRDMDSRDFREISVADMVTWLHKEITSPVEGKTEVSADNVVVQGENFRVVISNVRVEYDGSITSIELTQSISSFLGTNTNDGPKSLPYFSQLEAAKNAIRKALEADPVVKKMLQRGDAFKKGEGDGKFGLVIDTLCETANSKLANFSQIPTDKERLKNKNQVFFSQTTINEFEGASSFEDWNPSPTKMSHDEKIDALFNYKGDEELFLTSVPLYPGSSNKIQLLKVSRMLDGTTKYSIYHADHRKLNENKKYAKLIESFGWSKDDKFYWAPEAEEMLHEAMRAAGIKNPRIEVAGRYWDRIIIAEKNKRPTSPLISIRRNLDIALLHAGILPEDYDLKDGPKDANNHSMDTMLELASELHKKTDVSPNDIFRRIKNHPEMGDTAPEFEKWEDAVAAATINDIHTNNIIHLINRNQEIQKLLNIGREELQEIADFTEGYFDAISDGDDVDISVIIKKIGEYSGFETESLIEFFEEYAKDSKHILARLLKERTGEEVVELTAMPPMLMSSCKACPNYKMCTGKAERENSIARIPGLKKRTFVELLHNGIETLDDVMQAIETIYKIDIRSSDGQTISEGSGGQAGTERDNAIKALTANGMTKDLIGLYMQTRALTGKEDLSVDMEGLSRVKPSIDKLANSIKVDMDYEGIVTPEGIVLYMISIGIEDETGNVISNDVHYYPEMTMETTYKIFEIFIEAIVKAKAMADEKGIETAVVNFASYEQARAEAIKSAYLLDDLSLRYDKMAKYYKDLEKYVAGADAAIVKAEGVRTARDITKDLYLKYNSMLLFLQEGQITPWVMDQMVSLGYVQSDKESNISGFFFRREESGDVIEPVKHDLRSKKRFCEMTNSAIRNLGANSFIKLTSLLGLTSSNFKDAQGEFIPLTPKNKELLMVAIRDEIEEWFLNEMKEIQIEAKSKLAILNALCRKNHLTSDEFTIGLSSASKEIIKNTKLTPEIIDIMDGAIDQLKVFKEFMTIAAPDKSIKTITKNFMGEFRNSAKFTGGNTMDMINKVRKFYALAAKRTDIKEKLQDALEGKEFNHSLLRAMDKYLPASTKNGRAYKETTANLIKESKSKNFERYGSALLRMLDTAAKKDEEIAKTEYALLEEYAREDAVMLALVTQIFITVMESALNGRNDILTVSDDEGEMLAAFAIIPDKGVISKELDLRMAGHMPENNSSE